MPSEKLLEENVPLREWDSSRETACCTESGHHHAGRNGQGMDVEQLVLAQQCRGTILTLAHSIHLSGHLGTARRILQRFYWPTLYKDVAAYCKSCPSCQKAARVRKHRVPMVPLPIISEPFSRIAMDIVAPLPRSRSGMKYILVICDHATRYLEAIPLTASCMHQPVTMILTSMMQSS